MKDRELLKQLELKLMGRTARINDLERENRTLKERLNQTQQLLAEKKDVASSGDD